MAKNLDIDKLTSNPFTRVIIAAPSRFPIVAFMTGDFSIGGAAEYSDLFRNETIGAVSDFMTKFATVAENVNRRLGLETIESAPVSLKFVSNTLSFWSNSKKPQFTIDLAIVATKPSDDPRRAVRQLLGTVFPKIKGSGLEGVISAPMNYKPVISDKSKGGAREFQIGNTAVITIGKWFRATSQIITEVKFTFSRVTTETGVPLYAQGSITFEPARMIGDQDIADYITGTF